MEKVSILLKMRKNFSYDSGFFSLRIQALEYKTNITMRLHIPIMTTARLPLTVMFLQNSLPEVLCTMCFNEHKLPFKKEVLNTEIGHLYEHMLLECLRDLKEKHGDADAEYNGVTDWDWTIDPKGVFHITVDSGYAELGILTKALNKATHLLDNLFFISQIKPFSADAPVPTHTPVPFLRAYPTQMASEDIRQPLLAS